MYQTENIISKPIITSDGEQDFKIRYNREEQVGIITTLTDKSFFILDSGDYWYDLIQEKYPPVMKCSCKNDIFNITFEYTPRVGTNDFKEIHITCHCTSCQKTKELPNVKINYSPSSYLFEKPITFCKQPKIKYKKYSLQGFWSDEELLDITQYLSKNSPFIYCWYWDALNTKRCLKEISVTELNKFLLNSEERYLAIYFSTERLEYINPFCGWRKQSVFELQTPFMVESRGMLYCINFCSEYIGNEGNVIQKDSFFCKLVQDFRKYSKKVLN